MVRAGKRNLITDVEGLKIGQAEDEETARSGVTVLLADAPSAAAVDVRRCAGTRDLEALDPVSLVDGVDAIVLSGGSHSGSMQQVGSFCRQQGAAFGSPGAPPVPIVPGAIVFDLANGGKDKGEQPYRALGRAARKVRRTILRSAMRVPVLAPRRALTKAASAARRR